MQLYYSESVLTMLLLLGKVFLLCYYYKYSIKCSAIALLLLQNNTFPTIWDFTITIRSRILTIGQAESVLLLLFGAEFLLFDKQKVFGYCYSEYPSYYLHALEVFVASPGLLPWRTQCPCYLGKHLFAARITWVSDDDFPQGKLQVPVMIPLRNIP